MTDNFFSLHPFTLLFVAALLFSVGLHLWLATRQIRHVARHRSAVPEGFGERVSLPAHQRAADYTMARVRLGIVETAVSSVLLLAFTLLGGLQALMDGVLAMFGNAAQTTEAAAPPSLLAQILFVVAVVAINGLVALPIEIWRKFALEQRFGFNRTTPALFIADGLKAILVSAALGIPLLALVLVLMQATGAYWWLWTWFVWMAFNLAIMVLFPTVIAPLFNRFEPLPEGDVRHRVEALLARCRFHAKGLFVMDGSRRSAHGNAYFTGFGKSRRIVFFDTLLARLEVDEVEAVLAHELGHFKKKHILKRLVLLQGVFSLVAFALLGWLSSQIWFYQGLGIAIGPLQAQAPAGVALLLFFLALPVFLLPLRPLMAWMSRRDEFEADAFAVEHSNGQALVSALTKIYEDNASTLTPDPLHSAFYDSHPPAPLRIGRIRQRLAEAAPAAPAPP